MKEIRVSKHARERYAERVKEKNDKLDMARYVIETEAKIDKDISAMVEYDTLVYKGPQRWNEKNNTAIEIYVNDLWVVLLDSKTENVITLYKVELGCGEELNLTYMNKLMNKIKEANGNVKEIEEETKKEIDEYTQIIQDTNRQINEYRFKINQLQEIAEGYTAAIKANHSKVALAKETLIDTIGLLIQKRMF